MKSKLITSNRQFLTVLTLVLLLTGCVSTVTQNVNLKYGNPSGAKDNENNYLIVEPEYALSYNCRAGIPNWVSWQLDRSWLGQTERSDNFRPNPELPPDCYAVRPSDYRGSGYDRGHLAPSGDRTDSRTANESTFLMTNMMPQSPSNNREVWRELEEYSRDLAYDGKELYIVAGGEGTIERIAEGKVTVPEYTWKVILVLDNAEKPSAQNARAIAVWMPNSEDVRNTDWEDYIVSVDRVEKETGYNFFSTLPKSLQRKIESVKYR